MIGFEVTVDIAAPVVLQMLPYGPTLDSVLLSLLSRETRFAGHDDPRLVEALEELLQVVDGVPAASALWPDGQVIWMEEVHPRIPSPGEVLYWSHGRYPTDPPGYKTKGGQFKSMLTALQLALASRWHWWGVGDPDKVAEVLGTLISVGGWRGSGFGAVVSADIHTDPGAPWLVNGIEPGDFRLSRPVPLDRLDALLAAEPDPVARDELAPDAHGVVPLPPWPRPPWAGAPDMIPTMIPVLR